MNKTYAAFWLFFAGALVAACSSDRAALESRSAAPRDAAGRIGLPGVSAYASAPAPVRPVAPAAAPAADMPLVVPPVPATSPMTQAPAAPGKPKWHPAALTLPHSLRAVVAVTPPANTLLSVPPVAAPARPAGAPPAAAAVAIRTPAPIWPAGSADPRAALVGRAYRRAKPATLPGERPDSVRPPTVRPLVGLAKTAAVPTQKFTLDPARDTVVRSAGGTLVRVAAGAFVAADDSTRAAVGPLTLRLREFSSLPDVLLANLTTRAADGQLLETGGATWVEAIGADGNRCALRPGRDLHLAVPVRGARRPAMRAFTADSTAAAAEGLRWRPAAAANPADVVRARPTAYGPGLSALENTLRGRLRFTPVRAADLLEEMPLTDRRRYRKEWSESGRVLRYTKTLKEGLDALSIAFDVSENGAVSNWGTVTGYHETLRTALQEAVPVLTGPWRPGTCAGRAVAMRARLLVLCYADGTMDVEIRADPDDWTPCEGPARAQFVVDYEQRPPLAATADAEGAAATARHRPPAPVDVVGQRYVLDVGRPGWISCYRVADLPAPKITYSLASGAADADVRLVFRRARVVVAGLARGADTEFSNVPAREPVTVVAIRTDGQSQTWLATQPAVIGEPLAEPLVYRAVSLAELRSALALLDWKD